MGTRTKSSTLLAQMHASRDECSHPNLAVVSLSDGFDGGKRFEEILRDPTLDPIRINHIPGLVVQMLKPLSEKARTDHPFPHSDLDVKKESVLDE